MRAAAYAIRSLTAVPRAGAPAPTRRHIASDRPVGNQAMLRRTPCKSVEVCKDIKGDPSQFAAEAEKKIAARAEALKNAPPGSFEEQDRQRAGQRATHWESVLKAHKIDFTSQVRGFFINPAMDGVAGAATDDCADFPGGTPIVPIAKGDKCVQLPARSEDKAAQVDKPGPLNPDEAALVDKILRIGAHEPQHVAFDKAQKDKTKQINPAEDEKDPQTQKRQTDEPDCDKNSADYLLSEMSAAIAEFPVTFKNLAKQPDQAQATEATANNIATRSGESIHGAITKLKCSCNCQRVDDMVVKTVEFSTKGWPPDQKDAFLKAMTRLVPADWPQPLQSSSTRVDDARRDPIR